MAGPTWKITEHDEAGKSTATYVASPSDQPGLSRVDLIPPEDTKPLWQRTLDVFLPTGYPHSVTDDYLEYQIYDSLQAFSSSIAGLLASRAALSSVGVGDSTASPTAALLLSILQESAGRIATILFAHRFGTAFEPECKMYRLLADVLNDLGFVLDCLSPAFPKPLRVVVLSFSSVLRALCGVAAGSAKASLSAHFARWGNLGELNAKDSSQETVISLLGMLAGSVVVSWVTTPFATWTTLMVLLSLHLETNRRAVRAVNMRTLNQQRATLVYHHLQRGHVPTPKAVALQERIFETDGVLRADDDSVRGYCTLGAPFSRFLSAVASRERYSHAPHVSAEVVDETFATFQGIGFIMWTVPQSRPLQAQIAIKQGAKVPELLMAWWLALACVAASVSEQEKPTAAPLGISQPLAAVKKLFADHERKLREAGWDLDTNALETRSSPRLLIGK